MGWQKHPTVLPHEPIFKRQFDLLLAGIGLLIAAPIWFGLTISILLEDGRPVLFRQMRIGRWGTLFPMLKFRSMIVAPESEEVQSVGDDPRITKVGQFMRQTGLDELPQLWNIFRGDMSFVGPRPQPERERVSVDGELRDLVVRDVPLHEVRSLVRPGLTGVAQVYATRVVKHRHKFRFDALYVRCTVAADRIHASGRFWPSFVADVQLLLFDIELILRSFHIAWWRPQGLLSASRPSRDELGPLERLLGFVLKFHRPIVVVLHLLLIALANYLAFWLRFDGDIPDDYRARMTQALPWVLLVRGLVFMRFRLYQGLWRYTGLWDLRAIVTATALSSAILIPSILFFIESYPRSVFLVDPLLLVFLLGSVRLLPRIYREIAFAEARPGMLIIGAGHSGAMLVRELKTNPAGDYEPIGLVDDDPSKVGRWVHGVQVLGTRQDLADIIKRKQPQQVLIALPSASPSAIRAIVRALEPFKIPIKTVPDIHDVLGGRVELSQIRTLAVEDLLGRPPVGLDPRGTMDLIGGKRVLITGAGGSIGSELARQVSALGPDLLVLYERYENSLYTVANDLAARSPSLRVESVIGDVTDPARLAAVFHEYAPDIVFHAAAHKHVPLMERNPCEAVKNNILGSRMVAEAAHRHKASRFILISSDKAVNPTSVMGASKRVAELMVRELGRTSSTCFVTVRFGNVLGSNGSVVPRFMEQIKAGGPVTVTHPEMRRFFMLIPEAVQLVLQAAAMGEAGAAYVLEMGDEIRVVDMARNLIRLSGLVPDEDIPITFTGLRPGEKLSEELSSADEVLERSRVEKILRVRSDDARSATDLWGEVQALEAAAAIEDVGAVIARLIRIVPTFTPVGSHSVEAASDVTT